MSYYSRYNRYGDDGWGSNPERAKEIAIARNRAAAKRKRAIENGQKFMAVESNAALMLRLASAVNAEKNYGFLGKMLDSFNEWGNLTEKQIAAVKKVLDSREKQAAERAEQVAVRQEVSDWVGSEKERREFELNVVRSWSGEGAYGSYWGYAMVDDDGNEFIYMGVELSLGDDAVAKGDRVRIKATIKKHDQYEGVKQNKLARIQVLARPYNPRVV